MPGSTRIGEVPPDWPVLRLADGARLGAGASPSYSNDGEGPVSVIGANGVIGTTDSSNASNVIAVGRVGASGSVHLIEHPVWLSDNVLRVEPSPDIWEIRYLFHLLAASRLPSLASKTAQPLLTQTELGTIRLPAPSLPEQLAIAAVLDAVDDTIECTEAVIAATEELRRSLLHELLTRGVPAMHSEWKHVPGLGTVPACWEVTTLGEVCERPEYGAGAPAIAYAPSLPRYVRITDLTDDGRLRADEPRSADPVETAGYELKQGDLLFARSGATVGKTYLYREEDGPCVYAGYLIRFRATQKSVIPEFLEAWTRSTFYERWVVSMFRAGAQPNINATEYASLPLAVPNPSEQGQIVEVLAAIRGRLDSSRATLDRLARAKTSLSGALLAGHVRTGQEVVR